MKPKKFKHSLQILIPVSFAILLTTMVAVVVYITQDVVKPVLLQHHAHRIEDAGNMIVARINAMLGQAETVAVAIADITESLTSDREAIMEAVPRILDRKGYESFIIGGGVWPEPFRFNPARERDSLFWAREADGGLKYLDDYNSPTGPGYHSEEWYAPARYVPNEQAVWSRAYIDPYSHQPMVTCSIPMRHHGDFAGVATVDLKIDGIAALFSKAAKDLEGYIFAVDRNNRFLAFPWGKLPDIRINDNTRLEKLITSSELASMFPDFLCVHKRLEQINEKTVTLAHKEPGYREELISTFSADSYQIDKKEAELITAVLADPLTKQTFDSYLLDSFHINHDIILHEPSRATIFNMPETYWKVVIVVPEKSVTSPVNGITNRIMSSMVLLISCTLLAAGLILRSNLLVPLKKMTTQLKKISEERDNLSLELDIPADNELGELAYYFNQRTKALRDSEEKYRTIFNGAGEGISLSTLDGTFLAVNPRFAEICGYDSPEEVMSAIRTSDLYADINDRPRVLAGLKSGSFSTRTEVWFRKKDGTRFLASLNLGAVRDSNGNIMYLVAMTKDITKNKQLEAELRHAQKMEAIGTLAGGIAHDFNNILASIAGFNELAIMAARDNHAIRSHLDQIGVAADRARDLVQQILTFSRNSDQEKHPLDISAVIKEALKLLRSTIPSTIDIRTEISVASPILADPTGIHQVIMNLCTNAYHSMRETGGLLRVSLKEQEVDAKSAKTIGIEPGAYVILQVRDTGSGMDGETLNKIFEPYFTTKGKEEGTGLGLAVVHGIVESLHGCIRVESEHGKGTCFTVYLPVIEEAHAGAQEPEPESEQPVPEGCGQNIMFVDDEEMICRLYTFMLEDAGYKVTTFTDSGLALEHLRHDPRGWDLLITDMTMPGFSGEKLAEKARILNPNLPVIMCTGYSEVLTQERIERMGLKAFLQKPVAKNTLLIEVARAMMSRQR